MPGELIVSVSGISNRTVRVLDDFRKRLEGRGIPLSLLVAPRRKNGYRLESDPATLERLRHWRSLGDAVVLHGFDAAATKRRRSEFAALETHEANLRLIAADRALERIELRTRLFAAPGWIVSPGTSKALPRNGFRLLIGRHESTDLLSGTSSGGRMIGIGGGFPKEPWWCRVVVLLADRTARRGATVRLAVTAGQLGNEWTRHAVLDAVDAALGHGCAPAVYRWEPSAAAGVAA